MAVKLAGMSLKELKALRSKLDLAIQNLEKSNLSKAKVEVAKIAKQYGVSVETLIGNDLAPKPQTKRKSKSIKKTDGSKKVAPKYRHPNDASLTWTGRGLKPKWVVKLMEDNVSLADLLIK